MEYGFRSRAGRFLQEQKKHKRWMMGFLCLAGGVTLGTLAFLKLYGQAMTHQVKVLECQYEVHEHAEGCYEEDEDGRKVLVCGYADYVIHVHNDDCYDRKGVLVCPLEEHELHEHTDDCYGEEEILVCGKAGIEDTEEESSQPEDEKSTAAAQTETVLACGKEEHTHTDGCYPGGCSLSEHTHSGDCNREELTCSESEHEHGDGCYEDGELTCSKDEHSHGGGCYTVTTCPLEEHTHSDACSSSSPVCGMEEHTHSDGCYEERTAGTTEVPKAEAPEITKHVHTDDCYETIEGLICGEQELHIHDDSCYDEDCFDEDENLIEGSHVSCGLLQLEEHVHTEECFQIVELTAEEVAALNQGATLHVHDESCYSEEGILICGHEVTHIHGLDCYDDDGKLICEFANAGEHEHDADCYDEEGNLTCGHKEAKDHEHDADCYDEEGNLTCGYKGVKDHEHGTDCYDEEGNLICGHETAVDHVHRAECYDIFGNLICGYEDAADHVHTEDCYDEDGNLICGYKLRTSYEEMKVYRGGDYIVVARYNSDANLPEEAEFLAEQITPEMDEEHYANREAEYKELAGDEDASMRALLKIGFYVEEDGELTEVEPESAVEIAVQFLDEDGLPEGSPVVVIHFAESGTEKLDGSNAVDNSTTFQMESFSEIGIGYIEEVEAREVSEGVDGTWRIQLNDDFIYPDKAFQIRFHIEGEAILPKEEENGASVENAPESSEENGEIQDQEDESKEESEANEFETNESETDASEIDSPEANVSEAEESVNETEEFKNETKESAASKKLLFKVEEILEGDTYDIFKKYAEERDGSEALYWLKVMRYSLTYGGEELDLSQCKVTAEICPAQQLAAALEESVEDAAVYLLNSTEEAVQGEFEFTPQSLTYLQGDGAEETGDIPTKEDAEDVGNGGQPDEEQEDISGEEGIRTLADAVETEEDSKDIFPDEIDVLSVTLSIQGQGGSIIDATADFTKDGGDPVTLDMGNEREFSVWASGQPNPKFTVQYYANLDVMAATGINAISLINTSGPDGKPVLPKNGITGKANSPTGYFKYMYVDNTGKVETVNELTEVYVSRNFEYYKAPTINYMNALVENVNYELKQVWVLKEGKESTSIEKEDWDTYTYDKNLHFTNRRVSEQDNYVYIKDNAVLRFVYDTTKLDKKFAAAFYDYDISTGLLYRDKMPENPAANGWNNTRTAGDVFDINNNLTSNITTWLGSYKHIYSYTKEQGINSSGNYSGSGTKLAFGNVNTGTNLGTLTWSKDNVNNELNKYNNKGYLGCTFGLVTGMSDRKIQYASGVQAPKLFNEGSTTGKEIYDKGQYSLQFKRVGDTYTLSAVNGTVATDLDRFTNPGNSQCDKYDGKHEYISGDNKGKIASAIWTNNFWPMDSAPSFGTGTHDVKFGGTATFKGGAHEMRFGPITQKGTDYTFPESDDGKYHNSYFGMHYEVEFDLVADYVGPLEYYFFGDDDMWVFLDGKLVCDIGGVHSSVGEYVNLWDYLHKHEVACYDEEGKLTCGLGIQHEHDDECYEVQGEEKVLKCGINKKTLSFFYTERGASGSTCWMQFTLPSVSSLTPETTTKDYGQLKVEKTVTQIIGETETVVDNGDEFTFKINFTDANGEKLTDDYTYAKYDKAGNAVWNKLLIQSGGTFTLKNGEYIVVNYLPQGTQYTITESDRAVTVIDNTRKESRVEYFTDITYDGNSNVNNENPASEDDSNADKGNPRVAEGIISSGDKAEVYYNNKFYLYALPETGGPGLMIVYTVAGAIIVLLGAGLVYKKKFRERRV